MHKVLGYIRVSTQEQEVGYGLEVQRDRIAKHCAAQGWPEALWYTEVKSGESLMARVEIQKALADAEAAAETGQEVVLVVSSLDRLARDLIDQEVVVQRARQKGFRLACAVASEDELLDPACAGDPMRTAIRQFFGVINQLEKAIIQRRMTGGLTQKAAEGGFTGGRVPFGYRVTEKEISPDPDKVPVVQTILRLAASGTSLRGIVGIVRDTHPAAGDISVSVVRRVIKARTLYTQGLYRSRAGVTAVVRPDLVVVRPGDIPLEVSNMRELVRVDQLAERTGISIRDILTAMQELRIAFAAGESLHRAAAGKIIEHLSKASRA